MRRRRYGSFGTTQRTKKIRSPIRIKHRVAKKGGRCSGCRGRFEIGDQITEVRVKRRVFHTGTCVPPNIDQLATVVGQPAVAAGPAAMPNTPGEANAFALVALEHALKQRIRTSGFTLEMDRSFERYNKLKGMALRPGSDNEGRMAMMRATMELVKLVFSI